MRITSFFILVFLIPLTLSGQKNVQNAKKTWCKAINDNNPSSLKSHFTEKTCILYPKGEKEIKMYADFDAIEHYLKDQTFEIKKQKTIRSTSDKRGNTLEIGYLKTKSKEDHAYVTAWRNEAGQLKKEVHLVYTFRDSFDPSQKKKYDSDIDKARELWVDFSNSHRPSKLLEVLYTKNALYFNQGKLYKGIEEINEKYAYMSNQNWSIKLFADEVLQVSENEAIEIGHYKSSGVGYYILVWKKDRDGTWKVTFDFNF